MNTEPDAELSTAADTVLAATRPLVLVVEDEAMIAMLLEDMLDELGCGVVGPAFRVAEAIELAGSAEIDGAVLDVNLGGEKVYEVADALRRRNVPFAFASGYGEAGLRAADAGRPVLEKPYRLSDLAELLTSWGLIQA